MDFSKFRQTGELSDITVTVNGSEFKLHKFPLYAKSDFFCSLAKNPATDSSRIELKDFPGGADIFSQVADFCYSMKLDITKTNVVGLRCAAETLQMTGPGNLAEVTDKCFQDTITSAKMSRSTSAIASLLLSCVPVGQVAEKTNMISLCSDALVECWLKPPTKFSMPSTPVRHGNDKADDKTMKSLVNLPVDWFVKIIILARDKSVKLSQLAEMVMRYVTNFLDREEGIDKGGQVVDQKKADSSDNRKGARSAHEFEAFKDSKLNAKSKKKTDTGKILDTILLELPEGAFMEEALTTEWITRVLKFATLHGCICRRVLVKTAGDMLYKLSPDELCIVSPSVLHDILVEATSNNNEQGQKACRLVEVYLTEMARKGVLTAETYSTLISAAPSEPWKSHDSLYGVLEYVVTSEKDKLTAEQRQGLIDTINFSLLGEETLRRAFEGQIVPPTCVAKGALALCSRLKAELESAKSTVCKQEEELQRLRRSRQVTPNVTSTPIRDSKDSSFSDVPVRDRNSPPILLETDDIQSPRTQDVLVAARNKLANSAASATTLYNTFRPVTADGDLSFDDDFDYRYERNYRSLDNTRNKPRNYRSYLYSHRM
ncbi:hypothetical protein ACJMK2_005738 [Sinanodonta woodiana]|uniref:Uncharacterized protein n=1 Tax=Sinanodonta woodiana TaxID=1069815 RepID=A0ABD3VSC4_SINWO